MKKLMIVAAVAMAAVAANASKVTWGVGSALDTSKIKTGTMYLVYSAEAVNWNAIAQDTSFSESSLTKVGFTDTFDSFDYSATSTKKTTAGGDDGPLSPAVTGLSAGNNTMYYVCIANDGKYLAYASQAVPVNVSNISATKTKTASSFTYMAAATPEPTSGLLLLLGVAGLALRRKQK